MMRGRQRQAGRVAASGRAAPPVRPRQPRRGLAAEKARPHEGTAPAERVGRRAGWPIPQPGFATALLILAVLPLAISPQGVRLYSLPKLLVLRATALAGIGLVAAPTLATLRAAGSHLRQGAWWRNLPVTLALGYVTWLLLATLQSADRDHSLWGSYERLQGFATHACYVTVFLLLVSWHATPAAIHRALLAAAGASIVVSLLALAQQAGWQPLAVDPGYAGRATSTFGSPNALGAYLSMLAPILAVEAAHAGSGRLRPALIAGLALTLAALAATLARSGWVGASAGLAATSLLLALGDRQIPWRRVLAIIGGISLVLGLLLGGLGFQRAVAQRLTGLVNASSGTGAARLLVWGAALEAIRARPWFGYGPDAFAPAFERFYPPALINYEGVWVQFDRAHNEFLDTAVAAGLPALLVYLTIIGYVLRCGSRAALHRRSPDTRRLAAGLSGAIVGYIVSNQFNFGTIGTAPIFWALLGLLLAVSRGDTPPTTGLSATLAHRGTGTGATRHEAAGWWALSLALAGAVVGGASVAPALRADTTFGAAELQLEQGNPAAASTFARAIALAPREAVYLERFAGLLVVQALADPQQAPSLFARAADLYERAIASEPQNARLYVRLGDAYGYWARLGDAQAAQHLALAEDAFRRAVALAPRRAVYYQRWGDALLLNQRPADALPLYERALALGEWGADLYAGYSAALRGVGRTAEADAALAIYRKLQAEGAQQR